MGLINDAEAETAIDLLLKLPLVRYGHTSVLSDIWQLRNNVSSYDGAYVALAKNLDAPLVTSDGRLARAVANQVAVEWYAAGQKDTAIVD